MKEFLKILKELLSFLASYFNYKSKLLNNNLISDLDKTKSEIDKAIYDNDDDKINKFLNPSILLILSLSLLFGCTTVKYVPSDRRVKSLVYEGVEGKFVPNSVFSELLKSKIELDYYILKYGPINKE